jgi:hypothetical protein
VTAAVARIIEEVEQLTPPERVELRRLIVQQIPMSNDLTDEDFGALAADAFRALDEDESRAPERNAGTFPEVLSAQDGRS